MDTNRYPLANDIEGNPLDLPPEAVAWRVRRRSGKQGRPQCVYDNETGAQLELTLDATLDDLRPYGPGVYRLDAIDKDGKVIAGIIAQTEVPFERVEEDPHQHDAERESAATIRHLVDANVKVMIAMATAFGQVSPTTPPAPVVMAPPPAPSPPEEGGIPLWIQQLFMYAGPLIQQVQAVLSKGPASAAAAPTAPTVGGAS
jgi:hypothetical protein